MVRAFDGRVVVVTGGSAGLGWEIGRAFGRQGARVCLIARNQDRLQAAVDRLTRESLSATSVVADVTDQASVDAAFAELRRRHAQLDVLVNSAGISHRAAILDTTPEDFQDCWELNFLGAVRCTRAAAESLLAAGGHLVQVGSLSSKLATPYLGAYPASKFALAAYTQQLRLELAPRGLHVLHVCPGPIRRDDAGRRYDQLAAELPESARRPGGGARLKALDPAWLAERIVRACQKRETELVVPGKVRWLAALAQCRADWADWIIRRKTPSLA
jgi:NAD(P)-dependent dehydrogenase (short-subunit alcohol dehydrogenase family)